MKEQPLLHDCPGEGVTTVSQLSKKSTSMQRLELNLHLDLHCDLVLVLDLDLNLDL